MFGEWIGLGSLIAVNAGINIGIYKYFNGRLDRVYGRLDEVRDGIEEKFVRKDNCKILHLNTVDNLTGVESRTEKRIDKLEANFEQRFQQIINLLEKQNARLP